MCSLFKGAYPSRVDEFFLNSLCQKLKKNLEGLLITKLVSSILINATDSNLFHGYTIQHLNKRGLTAKITTPFLYNG